MGGQGLLEAECEGLSKRRNRCRSPVWADWVKESTECTVESVTYDLDEMWVDPTATDALFGSVLSWM